MGKGKKPDMKSLEEMMGNLSVSKKQIQKPTYKRPRDRAEKKG